MFEVKSINEKGKELGFVESENRRTYTFMRHASGRAVIVEGGGSDPAYADTVELLERTAGRTSRGDCYIDRLESLIEDIDKQLRVVCREKSRRAAMDARRLLKRRRGLCDDLKAAGGFPWEFNMNVGSVLVGAA